LVGNGGISDHRPILLQWKTSREAPLAPLKISQVWLEEEEFKNMVFTEMEEDNSIGSWPFDDPICIKPSQNKKVHKKMVSNVEEPKTKKFKRNIRKFPCFSTLLMNPP
jgi:hypothetical protein